MTKVRLHEEIQAILMANNNNWMTTQVIADEVNRRGKYKRKDGDEVPAFQIHLRTMKKEKGGYAHLFEQEKREGKIWVRCRLPATR